jgi:4-coumarate--CoA ligase
LAHPDHVFVEDTLLGNLVKGLSMAKLGSYAPVIHVWSTASQPLSQYKRFDIEDILKHGSANFIPRKLPPGQAAKELAFICFSSGTSGLVKGVKLSHGNVVSNIFQQSQCLQGMFTPKTVMVLVVPFFHILGLAGFSCQFVCQVCIPQLRL